MLENLKKRVCNYEPRTPPNQPQKAHESPANAPLTENPTLNYKKDISYEEQRGKRTNLQLRDAIVAALQRRPMTRHELSLAVKSRPATVQNHLEWLEKIRIVEIFNIRDVNVWRLVR